MTKITFKARLYVLTVLLSVLSAVFLTQCSNDDVDGHGCPIWGSVHAYRLTDDEDFSIRIPESIYADSSDQILTLSVLSVTKHKYPMPKNLGFCIDIWDEEKSKWISGEPFELINTPDGDGFFYIWSEKVDGVPVVRVHLKANDTDKERKVRLTVMALEIFEHQQLCGHVDIYQGPQVF